MKGISEEKACKGTLFVVGTPIGNLEDFSVRAIRTLKEVDFIAAEDTRVTVKLLNHFNIRKPMISYFEHNKREKGEFICNKILNGENCALVSDAGMPVISDPGEDLVALCAEKDIDVKVIPGPSALISALCLSALSSGRFTFEGFLSTNRQNRIKHLESIVCEYRTMIFYEAPHKLLSTLKDLLKYLGNRKISLVREITKIHEEVIRTDIQAAINLFEQMPPKGEFVLVIDGIKNREEKIYTLDEAVTIARAIVKDQNCSSSVAAKEASELTKIKKGSIYSAMLKE